MKKLLLLVLSLIMIMSLTACGENKQNEVLEGVGQTFEMDKYEYTLNSVELVEERNQYATTDPKYVVKVSYNVTNTTEDETLPVGRDVKAYMNGEALATYPLGATNETLEAGKTVNAIIFFGLDELGKIDFHFLPALSEEAVQIIEYTVAE